MSEETETSTGRAPLEQPESTCFICSESLTRPKLLPCQHVFCYSCLLSHCRDERYKITCPECDLEHVLPGDGLAGFEDSRGNLFARDSPIAEAGVDEGSESMPSVLLYCEHGDIEQCAICRGEHGQLPTGINTSQDDRDENLETTEDSAPRQYSQNQLATNVNYTKKRNMKCCKDVLSSERCRLRLPFGCAYHVAKDEIYVADPDNERIMVFECSGIEQGRVFYENLAGTTDVAISDDGEFVLLLRKTGLSRVALNGRLVRTIESFPLGKFENCQSVISRGRNVLILERVYSCVIVLDENDDYVRRIESKSMIWPSYLALAGNGDVYVTDDNTSCVHVFSWDGQLLNVFGGEELSTDIDGIVVDGDGFVCLSRYGGNRIDVYDPRHRLLTSFGRSGRGPGCFNGPRGLCLMPDGNIIVADSGNGRLQIF